MARSQLCRLPGGCCSGKSRPLSRSQREFRSGERKPHLPHSHFSKWSRESPANFKVLGPAGFLEFSCPLFCESGGYGRGWRSVCTWDHRHQLCLQSDLKKKTHIEFNQPELPHRGACLQTASSPIAQLSKNKTGTPTVFGRADKIAIPLFVACLLFSASSRFAPAIQR